MAKDPKLVIEMVIDPNDFVANIGRRNVAADEVARGSAGTVYRRCRLTREDPGLQKRLRICIQQRSRNRITREGIEDARGTVAKRQPRSRILTCYGAGDLVAARRV